MDVPDPDLQSALDALTGDGPFDWDAAAARAGPGTRATIAKLRLVATIASACRAPDDEPAPHLPAPPFTWGPLEVVSHVGRGAFGEVFRARDPRLERFVALKLLPLGSAFRHAGAAGTIREGRMLARVHHPHVVSVLGAEEANGHVGIWMELVEGGPSTRSSGMAVLLPSWRCSPLPAIFAARWLLCTTLGSCTAT